MKYYVSEPGSASVFKQMKAPDLVDPLDRQTYSNSLGNIVQRGAQSEIARCGKIVKIGTLTTLCPRVGAGKWLL
jgi:hypothetical protein